MKVRGIASGSEHLLWGTLCAVVLTGSVVGPWVPADAAELALRGATLIDLSDYGRSADDVENATILISDDRIIAAGPAEEIYIPEGAEILEATGKYLVPGLIDTFSVQNNEAQARAHLYMGVTSVFVNDFDERRGASFHVPNGPSLVNIGLVSGYDQSAAPLWRTPGELRANAPALDAAQLESFVDVYRWNGYGALLLYYPLSELQVPAVARRMRTHRMIAIGELGQAGVVESARRGVPLFVHFNRYLIDLAPPALREAVADDPFGPARARYMEYLQSIDPGSPELIDFARRLAAERTALVPTFAMSWLLLPHHSNPWQEPVAAILDPADIHLPADRETGESPSFGSIPAAELRAQVLHLLELHRTLASHDVKFVVGSGADAFGVLPGLGPHLEMELLVRIGLSPRQALAAATSNLSSLLEFVDFGVIRPGARADVLLLDADPREDISNVRRISRVLVRGRSVDRAALLEAAEVPAH